MPTNTLLANVTYSFSAVGGSGASVLAASVVLSAPGGDNQRQGRYAVIVTNNTSHAPLHVEPRVVFTTPGGVSTVIPHTLYLASNSQTYGGSAVQAQSLILLFSAQNALIPLEVLAGSALQIVVMAASNTSATAAISGAVQVWRL